MIKKSFDARQEILKYNKPFATTFGKYEVRFEPHLLGSFVHVSTKTKDEVCGTYLFADASTLFVVALGAAARELNKL